MAGIDLASRSSSMNDSIAEQVDVLSRYAELWREQAFCHPVLSWESRWPRLSAALRGLTQAQIDRLANDPSASHQFFTALEPELYWPAPDMAGVDAVACSLSVAPYQRRDIPGRKYAQIAAFVERVRDQQLPFLEWCAGKSHLGRLLSHCFNGRAVTATEIDPVLVREARRLAERETAPLSSNQIDVMEVDVTQYLQRPCHAVALHACGDLHLRLMRLVSEYRIPAADIAPCCYHLTADPVWRPLSRVVGDTSLALTRDDLRTAVQETVTAPGYARRARAHLQSWQLGWDLLRREVTASDEWEPIPRVRVAGLDFRRYCEQLGAQRGVIFGPAMDFSQYERAGRERLRVVSALDLVRHQFRRTLEQVLVADRAAWLQEQGYAVTVRVFCERALSPRNLMISARLG